jgi:hypothetical protein
MPVVDLDESVLQRRHGRRCGSPGSTAAGKRTDGRLHPKGYMLGQFAEDFVPFILCDCAGGFVFEPPVAA